MKKKTLSMAILSIVLIILISVIPSAIKLRCVQAQTDEEKALFNALRGRYQDDMAPQSVQSIINSFDAEQKQLPALRSSHNILLK